ncbi:MAG: hypothetical protein K2K91_03035 [Ruminococcus sp.]|nr:hypothetical protein [Ruminococcus sp.]
METNVDMSNISVVDGELIDYEYEQQKINAENRKKLKKFWFRLYMARFYSSACYYCNQAFYSGCKLCKKIQLNINLWREI